MYDNYADSHMDTSYYYANWDFDSLIERIDNSYSYSKDISEQ